MSVLSDDTWSIRLLSGGARAIPVRVLRETKSFCWVWDPAYPTARGGAQLARRAILPLRAPEATVRRICGELNAARAEYAADQGARLLAYQAQRDRILASAAQP